MDIKCPRLKIDLMQEISPSELSVSDVTMYETRDILRFVRWDSRPPSTVSEARTCVLDLPDVIEIQLLRRQPLEQRIGGWCWLDGWPAHYPPAKNTPAFKCLKSHPHISWQAPLRPWSIFMKKIVRTHEWVCWIEVCSYLQVVKAGMHFQPDSLFLVFAFWALITIIH